MSTPLQRPTLSLEEANKYLTQLNAADAPVRLLAFRGWFSAMGKSGVNDRKIYDDAIFVVLKDKVIGFNANTDPNGWRAGHGAGGAKGMASLKPGLWKAHKLGLHKGEYEALVQTGGPVTVMRDADASVPAKNIVVINGEKFYFDSGYFGINIHHGGATGTSSLGCQTIPPAEWQEFITLVKKQMIAGKVSVMQYGLIQFS